MNKELRKKIETELAAVIKSTLTAHNELVAGEISKSIRDNIKNIAKKFVKHLPAAPKVKKTKTERKPSGKPKPVVKKTARKKTVVRKKVKSKR